MKKTFLFLGLAAFLFVSPINAQSKKSEIDLGVGLFSSCQIVGIMSEIIVFGTTGMKMEDSKYIGALHIGYKYSLSDRFAFGPVFTYDRGTSNINVSDETGIFSKGKITGNYYSLALEGDYKYINSDKFKLYSLLGVGATVLDQSFKMDATKKSLSKTFFNYQVTPVGVKFGDSSGAFAELGFGYKGIICAGIFYRF
jgi:hypothetical protein